MDRKHDSLLSYLKHRPKKPEHWQAVVGRRNKRRWKCLAAIKRMVTLGSGYNFRYCQMQIENDVIRCKKQCNHCKEYYTIESNEGIHKEIK